MSLLREPPYIRHTVVTTVKRSVEPSVNGNDLNLSNPDSVLVTDAEGGVSESTSLKASNQGLYLAEVTNNDDPAGVPIQGGGVLYVSEGKLKYRGTTGTVTTVADA
jgi:hypothetical protein